MEMNASSITKNTRKTLNAFSRNHILQVYMISQATIDGLACNLKYTIYTRNSSFRLTDNFVDNIFSFRDTTTFILSKIETCIFASFFKKMKKKTRSDDRGCIIIYETISIFYFRITKMAESYTIYLYTQNHIQYFSIKFAA